MTEPKVQYAELSSEFDDFHDNPVSLKFRFRKPTRSQVERTNKAIPKSPMNACRNLLLWLVDPNQKDDLINALEEYSGIADTFTTEILKRDGWGSLGK